jgi:predicted AAA+ superfamily ATPase
VHAAISETYQDDFIKYAASGRLQLLQQLFREIPRTLGNKVKFSNLSRQYSATVVHQNVDLLIKAGVVQPIYHSPCSGVPIAAQIDQSSFKLLCLDVGLMNHICGINWSELSNMSELQLINSGGVAEQFIGQHLLYHRSNNLRPELYYWLREGRKGNAEVDYVMQLGNQILPIEVKAGKSGSLKSLFQFASRRDIKKAVRFDLNPPSRQIVQHAASSVGSDRVSFELISLPLYMVGQWQRWI